MALRTAQLVQFLAAHPLAVGDDAEDLDRRGGQLGGSLLAAELVAKDAEVAAQLEAVAGGIADDFVGRFVLAVGGVELADDLVDLVGGDIADVAGDFRRPRAAFPRRCRRRASLRRSSAASRGASHPLQALRQVPARSAASRPRSWRTKSRGAHQAGECRGETLERESLIRRDRRRGGGAKRENVVVGVAGGIHGGRMISPREAPSQGGYFGRHIFQAPAPPGEPWPQIGAIGARARVDRVPPAAAKRWQLSRNRC